jgi:hypothetical protein
MPDECPDATEPDTEASGSSSGGDSSVSPHDATTDSPRDGGSEATAAMDANLEVGGDEEAPSGLRCGTGSQTVYCAFPTPVCCIRFDAGASFSCVEDATHCVETPSEYPVACASNKNCPSLQPTCCFYQSGVKCETACSTVVCNVNDPPSDHECEAGHSCTSVSWELSNGTEYTLPYGGCQ